MDGISVADVPAQRRLVLSAALGEGTAAHVELRLRKVEGLERHDRLWFTGGVFLNLLGTPMVVMLWLFTAMPLPQSLWAICAMGVIALLAGVISYWLPRGLRYQARLGPPFTKHEWRRQVSVFAVGTGLVTAIFSLGRHLAKGIDVLHGERLFRNWPVDVSLPDSRAVGFLLMGGAVLLVVLVVLQLMQGIIGRTIRNYRERHDIDVGVIVPLIDALALLGVAGEAPPAPETRTPLVALLERIATNLEILIPESLQLPGRLEQETLRSRSRDAAREVLSWSLWVALPACGTSAALHAELVRLLDVTLTGRFHDLPRADPQAGRHRPLVLGGLRSVLAAILPLGLVVAARQKRLLPPDAATTQILLFSGLVWASVSLLLVLDAGLEKKLSVLKVVTEVLGNIRSMFTARSSGEDQHARGKESTEEETPKKATA